jgi:Tc5 transposase DNA-binding domain
MSDLNEDLDERAVKAVEEITRAKSAGERVSVAAIALEYRVSKFRLYRRLQGKGGRTARKPINKKLSETQEGALIRYIRTLDEIGLSVRLDQISNIANAILKEDCLEDDSPPTVGQHWPQRFLELYPGLHKVKQKPLELERKLAHDPAVILGWFERFQALREKFGVQNEDI